MRADDWFALACLALIVLIVALAATYLLNIGK